MNNFRGISDKFFDNNENLEMNEYKGINNKCINYDDYFKALKKLYDKALIKYQNENDSYIKNIKIKKYLYQRGYSLDDIDSIK